MPTSTATPTPRGANAFKPKLNCLTAAAGLLAMAGMAGQAAAQSRTDTIALTGQSAPGAGAGTFSGLFQPTVNDAGQVAFLGFITGSSNTEGVYRSSGGLLSALALKGQSAPGAGAGIFSGFLGSLRINNSGQVVFFSSIAAGGASTGGLFRSSGGVVTPIVLNGQSAGGSSGGGTFSLISSGSTVINDSGDTAFRASITGGTSTGGLYRSSGGTLSSVTFNGQSAPGAGAGTFSSLSSAPVLNNAGQVAFSASILGGTSTSGIFRSASGSTLTAIALQGQAAPGAGAGTFNSFGTPVLNNSGQTALWSTITGGTSSSGIYRSNSSSTLTAIAVQGQSAPGTGAGTFSSFDTVVRLNDAGQTAFRGAITGSTSTEGIFLSSSGSAVTAIALQGHSAPGTGTGTFSSVGAFSLNESGVIAFTAGVTGGSANQGLYLSDGRETVVAQLQGGLLASKTVLQVSTLAATALNSAGQLAYLATFTDSSAGSFLFTPALRWRETFSSGWDTADRWTLGITPGAAHDVSIDPSVALTVTGPAGNVAVRSLVVGSGTGFATLNLGGGTLGTTGGGVQIGARGILTGSGAITTQVNNTGEVRADSLILSDGLVNNGTVRGMATGNQRIDANLDNKTSGLVRVGAGETLKLVGSAHTNTGLIEARAGGEIQITGTLNNSAQVVVDGSVLRAHSAVTNAAPGRISLSNGTVYLNGGLDNNGQVQVTFGAAQVFGAITTNSDGKVILSGNSDTTFYDAVDIKSNGELRVSSGSDAVFFGQVFQRTGSFFTGSGTKFYEGGLSVGSSPGFGLDTGNVGFGSGSEYLAEIGGTTACTEECASDTAFQNQSFDKYVVQGTLTLGGTLKLASWGSFVAQAGTTFDLFDWGSVTGQFDAVDTSGLQLAEGTVVDTSRLGIDGSITIRAVPEPGTWALMGLGLLGVAGSARRGRAVA